MTMKFPLRFKTFVGELIQQRTFSCGTFSKVRGVLNHLTVVNGNKVCGMQSGESLNLSSGKFGAVITKTTASTQDTPVAVILGWNSSKGKHLKKYSKIFEDKSYDTICVPAKPINTFLRPGTKVKKIGHYILDLLVDLNCQKRPVFLYAFSNGGCAMFFHIMEALSYPTTAYYQAVPVVGTIFDSCPINPDIKSLKATKESVTDMIKNPIVKAALWYSMTAFIPPVIYLNGTVKRYMSGMEESPLLCPQLIFYSKTDKFAPHQDIDFYIQARRHKGIHVTPKCWDSSEHVNHYREHTDEYLKVLNLFTDFCLTSYHDQKK
ncbi:transmembrane protein 53-like [Stylophora pistillata]|uniref:Transmembrane protein 53 n=1 Tax=Stylophora pistillata TaxID=50429 RepID=A0A2B4SD07_STYPI|nr:transmembrane protein 53-like [Stylophora pistillata]PFX28564.1 Transmembrane protein 53 [Stylophora pistillata]